MDDVKSTLSQTDPNNKTESKHTSDMKDTSGNKTNDVFKLTPHVATRY